MSSIEIRVDTGGKDYIPHTFIIVTGDDGVERGYGFAPAEHGSMTGPGNIFDDTDHEYNASTGKIPLTPDGYRDLMDFINRSRENPPDYYLPFG